MISYTTVGIISGGLAVLAFLPYLISMYKKEINPHPFSWFLWAVQGFVTLVTYISLGALATLPLAIVNFFGPFLIFILTIKYWKGKFPKFDYICLGFSLIAIIIYIIFHQAAIALTLNLIGDFMAALPTIRKTYLDSSSENLTTWVLFSLSAIVSLLAIQNITYGILIFPLYLTFFEILMCVLIIRGRYFKK